MLRLFFLNLFIGANIEAEFNNKPVNFEIKTGYPWDGDIFVNVKTKSIQHFSFAIRKPEWCKSSSITINNKSCDFKEEKGYMIIDRVWNDKDSIYCSFEMKTELTTSSLRVRENIGKAALRRGPIVYCLEEEDNGPDLHLVYVENKIENFSEEFQPKLLNGINVITSKGLEICEKDSSRLYKSNEDYTFKERKLIWIPYYSWANRKPGEMVVWNKYININDRKSYNLQNSKKTSSST